MTFDPNWIIHPGETLQEELTERGLTQTWLARESGWTAKHINQVIKGHSKISPLFACMLEDILEGPSAQFWMNLQTAYDIGLIRGKKLL